MRRLAPTIALAALLVPLAVVPGHAGTTKTYTVKVGDDFFSPTSRTIHKNDIVKWVWVGADGRAGETINEHTIIEKTQEKLPKLKSGKRTTGTYRFRFKKTGKFTIICAEHPEDMVLKVRVKE
jgi:plastocyanin